MHLLTHLKVQGGQLMVLYFEMTDSNWTQGKFYAHHIWWHQALFYIQMGESESALTLYDDIIGPMTLAGRKS